MRFYRPFTGEQREVRKFAWYPIKIDSTIYWLEWITIRQSYNTGHFGWCNDFVIN